MSKINFFLVFLSGFLIFFFIVITVFLGCKYWDDDTVPSGHSIPELTEDNISEPEAEEIYLFLDDWKKAYESCSPDLPSFYVEYKKEDINFLLGEQAVTDMEIIETELEKDSDSLVYAYFKVKLSFKDECRDGKVKVTFQRPTNSFWKIFDISCEPENLLFCKKVEPLFLEEPEVSETSETMSGETAYFPSGEEDPLIHERFLPYENWTEEYLDYFQRHYNSSDLVLTPEAIVMHYTACSSLDGTIATFSNGQNYDDGDVGVIFGHLSVHYVIDNDGTIYQTLPLNRRCRGAYGVNHVAISIEMVASDETALLNQEETVSSSFKLVRYLMTKFDIPAENVWGHYEVAEGKFSSSTVKHYYNDYGDSRSPDCYPPEFGRSDPGREYMKRLLLYISEVRI